MAQTEGSLLIIQSGGAAEVRSGVVHHCTEVTVFTGGADQVCVAAETALTVQGESSLVALRLKNVCRGTGRECGCRRAVIWASDSWLGAFVVSSLIAVVSRQAHVVAAKTAHIRNVRSGHVAAALKHVSRRAHCLRSAGDDGCAGGDGAGLAGLALHWGISASAHSGAGGGAVLVAADWVL